MKNQNDKKAYLFLAPAMLLAALFYWFPALKSFAESFLTVNQGGRILGFSGLSNYKTLFSDKAFLNSVLVTLKFVVLFVPVNTALTLLAASMTRRKSRFSAVPEYIFFAPVAISLSTYSLIIKELFRGRASVINKILGTDSGWINEPAGAMAVLVVLGVFLDFGIDYILLMSAFRSEDRSVIEAARMDGAGGWRLFLQIEVPMIKETVLVTIFLALKDALLISAPIIILTEGGPYRTTESIMFYYYVEAFKSGNRAVQNALSALVLAVAALAMTAYILLKRKRK
ncbi:MAG: carbohydrate ABC transporter permease [Spirochaetales bacterium]